MERGDKLLFVVENGIVTLTTRRALVKSLRGSLARNDGRDLAGELLEERRREAGQGW